MGNTVQVFWLMPMGIALTIQATYDPRVAAGPVDLAWATDERGPRTMSAQQAGEFCELVTAWNVTGPVVDAVGELLVASREPVPLASEVVRNLPPWLTSSIARTVIRHATSRQGS